MPVGVKHRDATSTDLWVALNTAYPSNEWAVMPEVADGTGAAHKRWADAVAMNLWPSRGLELHGFEFKVSRSDWVRERQRPEKAEQVARFCDRWWLVLSRSEILAPGELPATWGLMVLNGDGKLKTVTPAAKREPEPMTQPFMASLLRAARMFVVPDDVVQATIAREREKLQADFGKLAEDIRNAAERRSRDLQDRIDRFEQETGVPLHGWSAIDNAREILRVVKAGGVDGIRAKLDRIGEEAKQVCELVSSLKREGAVS